MVRVSAPLRFLPVRQSLETVREEAWELLRKERFFGMIIPKRYGGLEFSAEAHSAVVQKLSSRSVTLAVTAIDQKAPPKDARPSSADSTPTSLAAAPCSAAACHCPRRT